MEENVKELLAAEGVDMKKTLARFMNKEALYEKFLKKLLQDTNFEGLRESVAQQNYEEVLKFAHTLKGVTANLGLDPLEEHFAQMVADVRAEAYGNIGPEFEKAAAKYGRFQEIIQML